MVAAAAAEQGYITRRSRDPWVAGEVLRTSKRMRRWDMWVGGWLGVWVCAGVRQGVRGGGGEGWGITERDRGLSELALSAMTPSFTPHTRTHPPLLCRMLALPRLASPRPACLLPSSIRFLYELACLLECWFRCMFPHPHRVSLRLFRLLCCPGTRWLHGDTKGASTRGGVAVDVDFVVVKVLDGSSCGRPTPSSVFFLHSARALFCCPLSRLVCAPSVAFHSRGASMAPLPYARALPCQEPFDHVVGNMAHVQRC